MTSRVIEVTFSWPPGLKGELVIRPVGGASKEAVRPKSPSAHGTKTRLPVGASYEWTLQDSAGRVLSGPRRFSILPYSNAQVLDSMDGADGGPTEIVQ
jgi:hypothetical protein